MKTQTEMQPPKKPPTGGVIASEEPDELKELALRIASLSPDKAKELNSYLEKLNFSIVDKGIF